MARAAAAVTAKDVARAAGVSQATVSYVINDTPHQRISPETRERVLAAVRELGYTPSAAARALRKGASDVVLLALPNVPLGPTVASYIEHLEVGLYALGLSLVTRRVWDDRPLSTLWRELKPVGVVGMTGMSERDVREMRGAGIFVAQTVIAAGADPASLNLPQTLIGRLQVEHLASRGHTRIGYGRPPGDEVGAFLPLRLEGVRMACVELGLDLPDVRSVPPDAAAAAGAVAGWRGAGVTGVCAYNDEVAFPILAALRCLGLRVPEDLAVIGVDNIPMAPFACPPLTTIDQNIPLVTTHLVQLIRAGIAGEPLPPMPRSESITLVVRESA